MRKQIITFVPATIGVVLSLGGLTVSGRNAVADDCILKPNAPSPQGSHWYYRTDRVNNRQCWYLRSDDGQAQGSQEPAETARDTSEDAGADDAQAVDQAPAAAPVKSEVAPPTTHRVTHQSAPRAEAVEPASSKPTRSQVPRSDKAATPAQQISATAPVPYTMPYGAWPWPSEMRTAEPAPTASIAPVAPLAQKTEAQAVGAQAPALQTEVSQAPAAYDEPKRVVPVRIPVMPTPNVQTADQSASQTLTERAQNQLQTQRTIVDDTTQHGTGESAYELLQKSFQRLTAPTAQGTEPDHTAALVTSALALFTIGIGVLVAARWSRRYQQQGPSDARWEMSDQDHREQDFSERDFSALDMNRQDMNGHDTNRHDINHPVTNYEALDEDYVRVHAPQHLNSLDAAIAAVHEVRYAKIVQNGEMMARLQAQSYPAVPEPPPQTTRYQPPPVEAPGRDFHPPQTASESSVSTHRIEDTLQKMLQEIEAKRRGHSPEARPELVHERPSAMQPPAGADEYGRPKRSRIRQA
jgi:hypothetical protein